MLIHLKTKLKIVNLIICILQNSAKRFDGLTGEQSSKPVINYTGPILERNKREKRVERLATKYHSRLNGSTKQKQFRFIIHKEPYYIIVILSFTEPHWALNCGVQGKGFY